MGGRTEGRHGWRDSGGWVEGVRGGEGGAPIVAKL